jgi:hypothetical protein
MRIMPSARFVLGVRFVPSTRFVLSVSLGLGVLGVSFVLGLRFGLGVRFVPAVVVPGVAGGPGVGRSLVWLTGGGVSGLAARGGSLRALAFVTLFAQQPVQAGRVDAGRVVGDVENRARTVGGHGSHTRLVGEEPLQAGQLRATEADVEDDLGDRLAVRTVLRVVAVLIRLVMGCHGGGSPLHP